MQIGKPQIEASYAVARDIHLSRLRKETGVNRLVTKHGMNKGSAQDYVKAFRCLMEGGLFTRTVNNEAAEYYLTRIAKEFGPEYLGSAVRAFQEHIKYYEALGRTKLPTLRSIVERHAAHVSLPPDRQKYEQTFLKSIRKSMADTPASRAKRLSIAPKLPRKVRVTSDIFIRNSDVVAEVLVRANGICQGCKKSAPFARRKDRKPYLEVHHKVQLANGGEDTVKNAIALCPNCHRCAHYG